MGQGRRDEEMKCPLTKEDCTVECAIWSPHDKACYFKVAARLPGFGTFKDYIRKCYLEILVFPEHNSYRVVPVDMELELTEFKSYIDRGYSEAVADIPEFNSLSFYGAIIDKETVVFRYPDGVVLSANEFDSLLLIVDNACSGLDGSPTPNVYQRKMPARFDLPVMLKPFSETMPIRYTCRLRQKSLVDISRLLKVTVILTGSVFVKPEAIMQLPEKVSVKSSEKIVSSPLI